MIHRALIAAALTLLAACMPTTVSFTVFADQNNLKETTVHADPKAGGDKVVIIDVRGLIADRPDSGLFANGPNPVDELTAKLRKAEQDPSVKAVILRINSPGGTVSASDMTYREVRDFIERTRRPVVASLSEIAASGGYFLALSADRIVAEPASITGSIGVIIPTVNVSEGLSRIGIKSRSITSKPNKDIANPMEPMREEHYAVLQAIVDEFYERFRALVIQRRGPRQPRPAVAGRDAPWTTIDESKLDDLTDGRVVTGTRAASSGLVDQTGGIHEAFDVAKALAGIGPCKLVKYYREDTGKPRTAYAQSEADTPRAGSEINLLQFRLGTNPFGMDSAGAYYLWLPPG